MSTQQTFKVVFHIDEIGKWDRVIGNVKNLLKEIDPNNAEIVVIANSEAVKGYLMPEKHSTLNALVDQNVVLNVCQNSLNGFEIDVSELPKFVVIVSAAVFELARKQHQGFAYIKP